MPPIRPQLLDELLKVYQKPDDLLGQDGLLRQLTKALVERALDGELTHYLGSEVRARQSRPLDAVYPVLYLDALEVKVKSRGRVSNKAIYPAFGVKMQGLKELSGMSAAETQGAKFRTEVVTELKTRGVTEIFIACVEGLKGFPEAIEAVYPQTQVQLCIVHLVRHSLS
jgi:putative transposase